MPFLALAGTVLGAAGSVMGGIAGKSQADYQAEIAQRNAILAGMNEASASASGQLRATEVSLAGANRLGQLKAAQASRGVDVNRGSAVDVRGSQREANIFNSAETEWNAQRAAWGYGQKAVGDAMQAQLDKKAGDNALWGGILGGIGQAVGGLGNVFSPDSTGFLGGASPTAVSSASVDTGQSAAAGLGSNDWPLTTPSGSAGIGGA